MMCQVYACRANDDVVVRCGAEKDLGVIRRHCRNGNKPTVIFQGRDEQGEDILTVNWSDGTFCILPETVMMWWWLLTIKAFSGCPVAVGDCERWELSSQALGQVEHGFARIAEQTR